MLSVLISSVILLHFQLACRAVAVDSAQHIVYSVITQLWTCTVQFISCSDSALAST